MVVITEGSVGVVTWGTDNLEYIRDNGVWYSYGILNGSKSPVATLQPELTSASPTFEIVQPSP